MRIKCYTILFSTVFILSACGGGGSGKSSSVAPPPTSNLNVPGEGGTETRSVGPADGATDPAISAIDIYGNYDIGWGKITINGDTFLSTVIGKATEENNEIVIVFTPANPSDFSHTGSDDYGNFFEAEIDGRTILAYENDDHTLAGEFQYFGGAVTSAVYGLEASNIPTSGVFSYEGVNIFIYGKDDVVESGFFTMDIDFDNYVFDLSGRTDTTSILVDSTDADTLIAIDTSQGRFFAENIDIVIRELTGIQNGNIYGSLHGDGATGVTGLYYLDGAGNDPEVYQGAILGTKQE